MSPLLRRPDIVPSLFSEGEDQTDRAAAKVRGSGRLADRLEPYLIAFDGHWGQAAMGPRGRALTGTSIVLLLMGKPLVIAGLAFVGMALTR